MVKYDPYSGGVTEKKLLPSSFFSTFWEEFLKSMILSKSEGGVLPIPDSAQTLTDASVKVVDRQTIMKFTKIMKETNEIANTFLWAYGSGNTLRFHSTRSPFDLNLSSGLATEVVVPSYSVWLAHGITAFLAWGVLLPFAVNSSLFRGLLPNGQLWFNLHQAFNTTAFASPYHHVLGLMQVQRPVRYQ